MFKFNKFRNKRRKAVSPILGAILLLGTMIVVIALVMMWGANQLHYEEMRASERQSQEIEIEGEELFTEEMYIDTITDELIIVVRNKGKFESEIAYLKINGQYLSTADFGISQNPVPGEDTTTIYIDNSGTGPLNDPIDDWDLDGDPIEGPGDTLLETVEIGTILGNTYSYSRPRAVIIPGFYSQANEKTTYQFDGSASNIKGSTIVEWAWDFDGGTPDEFGEEVSYKFEPITNDCKNFVISPCYESKTITLTVTDNLGRQDTQTITINVEFLEDETGGGGGGGEDFPIGAIGGTESGVDAGLTCSGGCLAIIMAVRNTDPGFAYTIRSMRIYFDFGSGASQGYVKKVEFPYGTTQFDGTLDSGELIKLNTAITFAAFDENNPFDNVLPMYLEKFSGGGNDWCGSTVRVVLYEDETGGDFINAFETPIAVHDLCLSTPQDGAGVDPALPEASLNPTFEWVDLGGAGPPYRVQITSDWKGGEETPAYGPDWSKAYCFDTVNTSVTLNAINSFWLCSDALKTPVLSSLAPDTVYFWRVMACGVDCDDPSLDPDSKFGPAYFFRTPVACGLPLPGAPTLVFPSNGAIDISVSLTFDWNDEPNASSYVIQYSTNPGYAAGQTTTMTTTVSDFTPLIDLDYNQTYYWHVKSQNCAGESNYSGTWSFTTEAPTSPYFTLSVIPTCQTDTAPSGGWSDLAGIYEITVNPFNGFGSDVYLTITYSDTLLRTGPGYPDPNPVSATSSPAWKSTFIVQGKGGLGAGVYTITIDGQTISGQTDTVIAEIRIDTPCSKFSGSFEMQNNRFSRGFIGFPFLCDVPKSRFNSMVTSTAYLQTYLFFF